MNISAGVHPPSDRHVAAGCGDAAVGIAAWPFLPVAPLPQVDFPTIVVSATYPGASPDTMAATVAQPLERQFSLIAGLTEMTSASYLGSTPITLQFDLDRNIDAAATDVLAAINAASGQLPTDLPSPPTFRKTESGRPSDHDHRRDLGHAAAHGGVRLRRQHLAQQISQIRGVGQVDINGQQKPAVRIQVDPGKISALGLGLEDIRPQIAAATVNAPKGTFDGSKQSVTVYDNDQILSAKPWNDVIVAYTTARRCGCAISGAAVDGPENTQARRLGVRGRRRRARLQPRPSTGRHSRDQASSPART